MAANIVDKLIGFLSPRAGLERHFHRRQLQRAYEAASPRDPWRPRRAGASADADHMADAGKLRAKSRALVQNVPYIEAGLTGLVANTIGTGIVDRAIGDQADIINTLKAEWKKECDADGRLDYDGMLAAAYRAMEQDGEVLVRLRPRYATDGLAVPLQMQLLEVDWIDSSRTGAVDGNPVVNGVEHDVLGRIVAYWLFDSHPGDVSLLRGIRAQSKRVPAANIIHLFAPARPGQNRGFPRVSPVIARVRDLQLYEDAELARKNLETRLGVLYSGDPTLLANPAANGEAITQAESDRTGQLGELTSGGISRLPPGSEVTVVAPTVATGYVEYVKFQLHLIASGMGVTYEMLTGDMNEVNFSSARIRRLDLRRTVEQMQWLTLKPRLLDPIHRAFIDAAYLAGKLRARNYGVAFSMPKWDYVNPQQEIAADKEEIGAGLCSISEKIRRRGDDPDEVFNEIQSDFQKLEELGIWDKLVFLQKGKTAADPVVEQAATENAKQTKRDMGQLGDALARLEGHVATLLARETIVNFKAGDTTVNSPEQRFNVEGAVVNVPAQAAPVIHNEIRNEAPIVNVPAAPAPVVNVPAAEVRVEVQPATVEVALKLPARETVTDVERDQAGRITRTVQKDRLDSP